MATDDNARPEANGTGGKRVDQTRPSVTRARCSPRPAIDYEGMGFTLGYAERAVIGSALLVLERAQ